MVIAICESQTAWWGRGSKSCSYCYVSAQWAGLMGVKVTRANTLQKATPQRKQRRVARWVGGHGTNGATGERYWMIGAGNGYCKTGFKWGVIWGGLGTEEGGDGGLKGLRMGEKGGWWGMKTEDGRWG